MSDIPDAERYEVIRYIPGPVGTRPAVLGRCAGFTGERFAEDARTQLRQRDGAGGGRDAEPAFVQVIDRREQRVVREWTVKPRGRG